MICKSLEDRVIELPDEIKAKFHKSVTIQNGSKYKNTKTLPQHLIQEIEREINEELNYDNKYLLFSYQIAKLMVKIYL